MKQGQKLYATDGTQVMLYPSDILYITQVSSPSSYSHCCGHPVDMVGSSSRYPLYAPCDCKLVYSNGPSVGNTRIYQSTSPVYYATKSGSSWSKGFISFGFTHDSNPPTATSFSQGDLIAHTGVAGNVTGDHSHFETSTGQISGLVSSGIYCSGGNLCYMQPNSTQPSEICFVNDTKIVNTQGLSFSEWDGGVSPEPGPEPKPEPEEKKKIVFLDAKGLDFFIF